MIARILAMRYGIVGVMAWLVAQDRVLATVEIADTWATRARGVLGRDSIDGALVLQPARSVHTIGVRFDLDVAYCDADLNVLEVVTMKPNRVGVPRRRARVIIEANARSFERWNISAGDRLELRL